MKNNPRFWFAVFTIAWIFAWIILATVDYFTHFIGIF